MGKVHKEIAKILTDAAEDQNVSNQTLVKTLTEKTAELMDALRSLADAQTGQVSFEAIKVSASTVVPIGKIGNAGWGGDGRGGGWFRCCGPAN